jgi:hypothetical protein
MLSEILRNSEDGQKSEAAESSNVMYQAPLVSWTLCEILG